MENNIRQLIAEGKLTEALPQLHTDAVAVAAADIADEITILESRLAENQRKARLDTHDPALIAREQNNIAASALTLLKRLPDKLPNVASTKGIREQTMKQHILFLTFLVKASVVLWLFNHWQSGGFSADQFAGTLTLLLPVLAAYTGLMFQDLLDHRHLHVTFSPAAPRIGRSVQWTIYLVIFFYWVALTMAIGSKAEGIMSYAQLSGALALIESGLGIYLTRIVRTFFPAEKQSKGS